MERVSEYKSEKAIQSLHATLEQEWTVCYSRNYNITQL